MNAAVTPDSDPSPWIPERDPQNLKALGKLAEELNECGAAVARCIIQGIDEAEPVSGKPNRQWLQEEIADVEATLIIVKEQFGLDQLGIAERCRRKAAYIARWLGMIPHDAF